MELQVNKTKWLRNNQYYPTVETKSQIFLHHTAGLNAAGAINWWNTTPEHVGVAYVIDRDGTIFQCFDDNQWGYHLGIKGDDDFCEKHSVGIEIVSAGGLVEKDGKFFFYPLGPSKPGTEIPKEEVEQCEWRGYKYFHAYNGKQIDSLSKLISFLLEKYPNIKIQKDWENFYNLKKEILSSHESGVWSHTTVREDKCDVYPSKTLLSMLGDIVEKSLS